jgi:hypothetical protein
VHRLSLKDQVKAVQTLLPITVRHENWLTKNSNPVYSDRALAFAAQQLAGVTGSQRLRKKMFRASAATTCTRAQIFKWIGMPARSEIDSKLANIFATGNFLHLKWQMQGLTEGWLEKAEVPVDRDDINAGGTMDGVLYTGGGLEFKSINDRGFNKVTSFGPLEGHLWQVHNYMYLGELNHFSVVYENKNTGEWREFRVDRNEALIKQAEVRFIQLNEFVEAQALPRVLPDCKVEEGTQYRQCPYRDVCLKTRIWPRVKS